MTMILMSCQTFGESTPKKVGDKRRVCKRKARWIKWKKH